MRTLSDDKKGILSSRCGKYNPKLDYLFCKNLSGQGLRILNEEGWRDVFDEKSKPHNKVQETMMKGKKILALIRDGKELLDVANKIHVEITGEQVSQEDLEWLAQQIRETNSISVCDLLLVRLLIHFAKKPFGVEISKSFALLFLTELGHPPVCFYQRPIQEIDLLAKKDLLGATNLARNLRFQSESLNRWHDPVPASVVFSRLRSGTDRLKRVYGVRELLVYGSYAKGDYDGYSDLDVLLRFDKSDGRKMGFPALGFIRKITGIPVDGHCIYATKIDTDDFHGEISSHSVRVI